MDKPCFQISIRGDAVVPDTVSAAELGELLTHLERSILAAAKAQDIVVDEASICSLVDIKTGSSKLTLAVSRALLGSVVTLAGAVAAGDYSRVPSQAHSELMEIYRQSTRKKWSIEFQKDKRLGIEAATISERHPIPPPVMTVAKGTTCLFGRCLRVGGETPRAQVRLESGDLLYLDVSEDMAKQLAKRLYEDVCIEGEAKWSSDTWQLQEFKATRITNYEGGDLRQTFVRLAASSRGRWKGVDAAAFVRDIRNEAES